MAELAVLGWAHPVHVCTQKLEMLALGHLPARDDLPDTCTIPHWSDIVVSEEPLPEPMSRLTALTSLALYNVGWTYTPAGIPHLAKVLPSPMYDTSTSTSADGR